LGEHIETHFEKYLIYLFGNTVDANGLQCCLVSNGFPNIFCVRKKKVSHTGQGRHLTILQQSSSASHSHTIWVWRRSPLYESVCA